MAGDVHAAQPLYVLKDIPCPWTIDHLAAQFGLCRMHGYIQRRQLLLIEPLPVVVFQIGQGDKVAKEE